MSEAGAVWGRGSKPPPRPVESKTQKQSRGGGNNGGGGNRQQHNSQQGPRRPAVREGGGLRVVQLDGLVLLKIIKHCTQSLPELCAGSLLGMDTESHSLEVTNCFPFPVNADDDPDYDATEYHSEMMKLLRDVNVDNNSVGWYRSAYMGSFCTSDLVEHQFNHQSSLDQGSNQAKSVVIIYDPFQTQKGKLGLKAMRLSDKFMKEYAAHKASNYTTELNLSSERVLEEVPIEITNPEIVSVFLNDMVYDQQPSTVATTSTTRNGSGYDNVAVDFDRLDLSTNVYLEKNLEFLVEEVDNLGQENQKMSHHMHQLHKQKQNQAKWLANRRLENAGRQERGQALLPEEDPTNPIFKPIPNHSKLESLLIRSQISVYCDQINTFAGTSFSKLFLLGGVQK